MISDKVIFQYGNANEPNYIFYKQQFKGQLVNGIKEQTSDSALMDGKQRLNGANRNKRAGYLFQYDFKNPFFSIFTTDFINRVFFGQPRLAFWYQVEEFADNPTYIRPPSKWFYNVADCTVPPALKENERNNNATPDAEYSIGISLEKPYLYDCSSDIEYVDLNNYLSGLSLYGTAVYGTSVYGSTFAPANVSGLTDEQKTQFFVELDVKNINYFLYLRDRFFNRDTTQTNRNYVYNQTITASTFTDTNLTNAFRESPTDNQIYRIELSDLAVGQTLTIENLSNNSGIVIEWLDASTSPTDLVYNSYHDKLYSGANETEVDSSKYTVYGINSRPLYFSGLLNPRPFETIQNETIRVTNNSTNTPTMKIDALITY